MNTVNELDGLRAQLPDRAGASYFRLVWPLRWHGSHLAEVNENINRGYSQDQGYS